MSPQISPTMSVEEHASIAQLMALKPEQRPRAQLGALMDILAPLDFFSQLSFKLQQRVCRHLRRKSTCDSCVEGGCVMCSIGPRWLVRWMRDLVHVHVCVCVCVLAHGGYQLGS
jgi:hypothetical protein